MQTQSEDPRYTALLKDPFSDLTIALALSAQLTDPVTGAITAKATNQLLNAIDNQLSALPYGAKFPFELAPNVQDHVTADELREWDLIALFEGEKIHYLGSQFTPVVYSCP